MRLSKILAVVAFAFMAFGMIGSGAAYAHCGGDKCAKKATCSKSIEAPKEKATCSKKIAEKKTCTKSKDTCSKSACMKSKCEKKECSKPCSKVKKPCSKSLGQAHNDSSRYND